MAKIKQPKFKDLVITGNTQFKNKEFEKALNNFKESLKLYVRDSIKEKVLVTEIEFIKAEIYNDNKEHQVHHLVKYDVEKNLMKSYKLMIKEELGDVELKEELEWYRSKLKFQMSFLSLEYDELKPKINSNRELKKITDLSTIIEILELHFPEKEWK